MNKHLLPLLMLAAGPLLAAPIQPVVLAVKGELPYQKGQALPAGTNVRTGETSALALAVAPGQLLSLGSNTQGTLSQLGDLNAPANPVFQLLQGQVRGQVQTDSGLSCLIEAGTAKFSVETGRFSASVSTNGGFQATLLTGKGTIALGGQPFRMGPGTVILSGPDGSLRVLDLTTGQVVNLDADGTTQAQAASATELAQAAALFQRALADAAADGAVTGEVLQVLTAVNQVLAANQIAQLVPPPQTGGIGQNSGTGDRDSVVSPEAP